MAVVSRPTGTKVPDIRKGDTVVAIVGRDTGKSGVVERVIRNQQGWAKTKSRGGGSWKNAGPLSEVAVVVTGLNISKRHTKPRQSTSATDRMPKVQAGGILEIAQPLSLSKVMIVCPECKEPTRIGHELLVSGERVRTCKRGHRLEVKS
jgi:large subunit ribosomal protein L24